MVRRRVGLRYDGMNNALTWGGCAGRAATRHRVRLAYTLRCPDGRPSGGPMAGASVTRYDVQS